VAGLLEAELAAAVGPACVATPPHRSAPARLYTPASEPNPLAALRLRWTPHTLGPPC